METFDDESLLFKIYKDFRNNAFYYCGNKIKCWWIHFTTNCFLFNKLWKNNSGKGNKGPDYYNKFFRLKLEMMRVHDCVDQIDGTHVKNAYEKEKDYMTNIAGKNYKDNLNGTLFFNADTSNDDFFNYYGYVKTFKRVIEHHSSRINNYRNHPFKKGKVIFFVFDESSNYIQLLSKDQLNKAKKNEETIQKSIFHSYFFDKNFLDVIKDCTADYLIWIGKNKSIYNNGKELKYPKVCIFQIKKLKKIKGHEYNPDLMYKIKKEYLPEKIFGK